MPVMLRSFRRHRRQAADRVEPLFCFQGTVLFTDSESGENVPVDGPVRIGFFAREVVLYISHFSREVLPYLNREHAAAIQLLMDADSSKNATLDLTREGFMRQVQEAAQRLREPLAILESTPPAGPQHPRHPAQAVDTSPRPAG